MALYDVRIGPLSFICPVDAVGEGIGDGLDVVGAALTASERKPRPLKLKLPVRSADGTVAGGEALRRQVRQLIDNARWRLQGFYLTWNIDKDFDCWLLIGSAEVTETAGIGFGEWDMELSDVFIAGRPGSHRPGRRAAINDLRTGEAPRDTRRLLYSTDFSGEPLPTEPIFIPGEASDLVRSGNRPVVSTGVSLARSGRHLWRTAAASDAEVLSYLPDATLLTERTKYLDLDSLGDVNIWDLSKGTTYEPGSYTTANDTDPTLVGWEPVLGGTLTADHNLAMDNGQVRVRWLGSLASQGLALEYWDPATSHFRRMGRLLHSLNVREQRVIEATPERSVLEWRAGRYAMRAILQRGWWGPRMEVYDDGGSTARLEYAWEEGSGAAAMNSTTLGSVFKPERTGAATLLVGRGSTGDAVGNTPTVISGVGSFMTRNRVMVVQLGCPGVASVQALASLAICDARPVPVLIGRG